MPAVNSHVCSSVGFVLLKILTHCRLIIDHKQRQKRAERVVVCVLFFFLPNISKELINPSTSESFYFWKNPLCVNSRRCLRFVHVSSVFTVCIDACVCLLGSLHCQHV